MLKHIQIPVTAFMQNCSIIYCDETKLAVAVDPGGDVAIINQLLNEKGLKLEQIWLTHGHLDHVGGTAALMSEWQVPVYGPHKADEFWLNQLDQQAQMFGFLPVDAIKGNRWLVEGVELTFAGETFNVLHTPGHTPGHVVLYSQALATVFVGDVLFQSGVGRSDFPMGDHGVLMDSIKTKLYTLPDDTVVVPGHGPNTTIGIEKRSNPYVQA